MRLSSWNINGLRAIHRKGGLAGFVRTHGPDTLCLQETKVPGGQVPEDLGLEELPHRCWHAGQKPGYSGTAILSREEPVAVERDLPVPGAGGHRRDAAHPEEGRVIAAEFAGCIVVNTYTPNAQRGLARLPYRRDAWDPAYAEFLRGLSARKPVIACGDFNCAHTELDLARPKENVKNAGFTPDERAGFTHLLEHAGLRDAYRELYPDTEGAYTWWTYRAGARGRNIGWRLDYFLVSEALMPAVRDVVLHQEVNGSDHCPVSLDLGDFD